MNQQWSCDACTFKQSANAIRCAMCMSPNPFQAAMGGASASATSSYFHAARPPRAKPVVKEELRHQAKPRANGEFGKVVYQTKRISKQQVLDSLAIYQLNSDIASSSWPLFVFGENDIDKVRPKGSERDMIGGLAGVLGDFDSEVAFGVTTTFYADKSVNHDFGKFKRIIDADFVELLRYVRCGHDIIVPSPNLQDLHGYHEKSYWETVDSERTQVIFHNIGTGLAMIPFQYIKYIQRKFDELKAVGDSNGKGGDKDEANAEQKDADDAHQVVVDEEKGAEKQKDGDEQQEQEQQAEAEARLLLLEHAVGELIHLCGA